MAAAELTTRRGKKKGTTEAVGVDANGHFSSTWAIKLNDGDPLTRRDIQFDLLSFIFGNSNFQFTPPQYEGSGLALFPVDRHWTFAELYLDALANSPKAARNLREKMAESQQFAVGFAKVGLLINSGRLNTTVALNPEVKAQMRTYHSMPAIQLDEFSRKNIPDAPRMKAQLKSCVLSQEVPTGPTEGLRSISLRSANGQVPSTTPINLIFWLFADGSYITERYLPDGFDFNKIFYDMDDVRSSERADAFLAVVHHFLESPQASADFSLPVGQKVDLGIRMQRNDGPLPNENIDTPEEVAFAEQMATYRRTVVVKNVADTTRATRITSVAPDSGGVDQKERTPSIAQTPVPLDYEAEMPAMMQPRPQPQASTSQRGHAIFQSLNEAPLPFDLWWKDTLVNDRKRKHSLLQLAWERTEADLDAQRDPLYDSDTEYDPTQPEARPIAGTTPWSAKELTARLHPGYICRGPDGEPGRCRFAPPPGRRTATSEAEMEPSTSVNGRRSTSRSPVKSEVVDGMAMYTGP